MRVSSVSFRCADNDRDEIDITKLSRVWTMFMLLRRTLFVSWSSRGVRTVVNLAHILLRVNSALSGGMIVPLHC